LAVTKVAVQTPVTDSKLEREALEELIGAQALSADLKTAIVACLSGAESRRWTVGELFNRLNLNKSQNEIRNREITCY
jgi:hypothetical protein